MKSTACFLLLLMLLPACSGCTYTPHCIMRLQHVGLLDSLDRPVPGDGVLHIDSSRRAPYSDRGYGREVELGSAEYHDRYVAILWNARHWGLSLTVENKTSGTALIHWAGARIIDPFGAVKGVVHGGVNYGSFSELGRLPQAPTRLPSNDRFKDDIIESDGAVFDARVLQWYGRRLLSRLLPESGNLDDAQRAAAAVLGKNFSVILPVEIAGQMRRYHLRFHIVDTMVVHPGPI